VRGLLVDTNVIVWLLLGDRSRVSEAARDALPVTSIHAEAVEQLPWHHRDPFDRLLVAQAKTEGLELVSADARLAAYGVGLVW
jgi:PIN domain nuclease of toxin-antitoxin system